MKVSLQLFASLREAVGRRDLSLEVDDGSRVSDLRARLASDYPSLGPLLKTVVFAIDDEYVSADERLHDGAAVALIPPVSGGSGERNLFWLTYEPIEAQAPALAELGRRDEDGA